MRVLVTGCAGFVGSHLSERLIALGHDVVGVDCLIGSYAPGMKMANLQTLLTEPRFSFSPCDLVEANLDPLLDGVDVIYHQAGQPGVRASWGACFETYARNNIPGHAALARSCQRSRAAQVRVCVLVVNLWRCRVISNQRDGIAEAGITVRRD